MGIYNDGRPLPETLKKNQCPFCNQNMTPVIIKEKWQSDSFEFKCNNCNPNTTISLSGSIVVVIDNIIKNHSQKLSYYQKEIQKTDNEVICFTSENFS